MASSDLGHALLTHHTSFAKSSFTKQQGTRGCWRTLFCASLYVGNEISKSIDHEQSLKIYVKFTLKGIPAGNSLH
jgi:hypothetical protein